MILVTGGLGFLGSRLVRALAESGTTEIRCLVRPGVDYSSVPLSLKGSSGNKVTLFPASFEDPKSLAKAVDGVDIVYHAAASKAGSFASMVNNTVAGSENLYRACVQEEVKRFVLVSSFSVIGVADLARGAVVDESAPIERYPERRDPYAFSKQRQETLAWEYHRSDKLPLVVVRPGVIFGPGGSILGPRIGVDLFGIYLHLGGSNPIPLTYVDNCADAILKAGTTPDIEGETFCIVDDNLPTSKELLRKYSREVTHIRAIRIPRWLLHIISRCNEFYTDRSDGHLPTVFKQYDIACLWKKRRFSNNKVKRSLGWNPQIGMEEALKITLDSLKRQQEQDIEKAQPHPS